MSDESDLKKWDPSQCDPKVLRAFRKLCLIKIQEKADEFAMESFAKDPGPVSNQFYFLLNSLMGTHRVILIGN